MGKLRLGEGMRPHAGKSGYHFLHVCDPGPELYPRSLCLAVSQEGVWSLPPSQMSIQGQPAGKGTGTITEHILSQAWAWARGVRIRLCPWEQALGRALGWLLHTRAA